MLKLYIDESYDQKKRMYLVAGFVAPVKTWDLIEKRWSAILKKFGVDEYKSDDCFHGKGEFKGKETQRDQITNQLVRILTHPSTIAKPKRQRPDLYGITFAINWDDFDEVMPAHNYPHPYAYLFQRIIRIVSGWTYDSDPNERIQVIVDESEFSGDCVKIFNSVKSNTNVALKDRACLGGITSQSSRCFLPLQAADLLAYRSLKYLLGRKDRGVIDSLLKYVDLRSQMVSTNTLLNTLKLVEEPDWKERHSLKYLK